MVENVRGPPCFASSVGSVPAALKAILRAGSQQQLEKLEDTDVPGVARVAEECIGIGAQKLASPMTTVSRAVQDRLRHTPA